MFEDQETRLDKEAAPQTTISSSSLDEVVMPPSPYTADDFWQFQDRH